MEGALVREAIREQTPEQASGIMSNITPDILKDSIPGILQRLDNGESSEVLAESTVDGIFNTVEATVLGESFDFIYERFGDRIMDMVLNGSFLQIFEKVSLLFS